MLSGNADIWNVAFFLGRVVSACNWSTVWSSSHSNFYPDDVLDYSYTNSFHLPIYGVDQLPVNVRKVSFITNKLTQTDL